MPTNASHARSCPSVSSPSAARRALFAAAVSVVMSGVGLAQTTQPTLQAATPATAPSDASALVGQVAPAFTIPGLDGASHSLGELKGRVAVLDFWGTYCLPCRMEMPHLDGLAKKYADQGLTIWSIDEGNDPAKAKTFLQAVPTVSLPVLIDGQTAVGQAYSVDAVPQLVVIGRDGRVKQVFTDLTPDTQAKIEPAIVSALGQPQADSAAPVDAPPTTAPTPLAAAPAAEVSQPAAPPAVFGPTTTPVDADAALLRHADPAVRPQLESMARAYLHLKTAIITATMKTEGEIDGQKAGGAENITSAFDAGGRFRHEASGDVILSDSPDRFFAYLPSTNIYATAPSVPVRTKASDLPLDCSRTLRLQNLPLYLALSEDPVSALLSGASAVASAPDVHIGDARFPAIKVTYPENDLTVAFDPQSGLIRQTFSDDARGLAAQGANVKFAHTTIDFQTQVDPTLKPAQIAFNPPPDAQMMSAGGDDAAVAALEGKPVPAFKLMTLDGKVVSSDSLKGSVYLLDFWATWCPPCRAGLEFLNTFAPAQAAKGLKVFAVNQQEDPDTVKAFVQQTKLGVTVLMDPENIGMQKFAVNGIPETLVIGRDGVVLKTFVGLDEEGVAAAVGQALAKR